MTLEKNLFKVFIDFDGTITRQDIGENMFLKFGDAAEANRIVQRWINEEINSVESWIQLCGTIKYLDHELFDDFLSRIEIDEYFNPLRKFCLQNSIDMYVLSDGLDFYIDKFLSLHSIDGLKVYSNKLGFSDDGRMLPKFPYTDGECKRCANCKRNHIINHSADSDFTVYIGDGYSDTCPAQFADFIFAKNSLLRFCETNRISYYPFNDLGDVIKKLDELISKKKLKKRHQAVLKRKDIYQLG